MANTDGSKDRAPRRLSLEEVRRLARILRGGRGLDGSPLPLRDRIARVGARFRNLGSENRKQTQIRRWIGPGTLLVLFLGLIVLFGSGLPDTWGGWGHALFWGTLAIGCATVWSWHRALQGDRHRAFWLLGALSFHVVLLGALSMRDCFTDRVPFIGPVYHSLLLFTGATGAEGCATVTLGTQLAEIGGITVLSAAVFTIINEISSDPIARLRARWASRVILVTGLSDDTLPVIRSLVADSDRSLVVVAEPNPDHPLIHQARRYGARVIRREISTRATDLKWLTKLCTSRGKHVSLRRAYLLSSDEQSNLEAAQVIRDVLANLDPAYRDEHRAPTRLIVRIDRYRPAHHHAAQQTSWWRIDDQNPADQKPDFSRGPRVFVSTLGRTQVIAHALAERLATRGKPAQLLIVGESDLAHAFDDEWRLQRASAELLLGRMTTNQPWRDDLERRANLPEPDFLDELPDADQLRQRCTSGRVSILLTQEPDETTRSHLESLAIELAGQPIRIFIPTTGVRGLAHTPLLGCLHPFGPSLGGAVVNPEKDTSTQPTPLHGVPQDSWFRAAKLVADSYGIDGQESSWASLTSTDRDSNFRAAWSLLTWLAELGHTWSTTRPQDHQPPSDDLLDLLVPLEHLAWMTFKHDTGWVGFDGASNDNSRLLNRLLHPLDDLDEARRRDAVEGTRKNLRGLLGIFKILGFHPVPPQEPHDHWWRLRRAGTIQLLETLTAPRTWTDDNGNELQAAPGDLWIADDTTPPSRARSITPNRFHATHRHLEGNRYRRTGEFKARIAAVGEQVTSTEGPQTAGADSWVIHDPDGGNSWIITSADLNRGYVATGPWPGE
ncbi:MAG: hypothetical protein Q4D96_11050 [Propionibacteriaceae bacterium]|nr:hypothetical protein [Propionibacteriaceae bacterium]